MNRKNLTAAVLAGLAGVAGIAGTAQAVNINPDGLGQVLLYPYYTSNDGNQTLLSVVNTTEQAKAVKVRFLEGFNSREVLDFNLYMSEADVWVAAIADVEGTPTLMIPDTSCTVPYLYGMGVDAGYGMGMQPFLDIAYSDNGEIDGVSYDFTDGGPTGIARAAEGHFEMIEMGTIFNDSVIGEAVTHDDETGMPADCEFVVEQWTADLSSGGSVTEDSGQWILDTYCGYDEDEEEFDCDLAPKYDRGVFDINRNSGGLFGGAAVVNSANGTMFSYDAIALQGFDKTDIGLNFEPGTIYPSLNSGSESSSWVFFGTPTNQAVNLDYDLTVDAVSSVFMKSNIVNEYVIDDALNAGTEWIITFPTKNFYADSLRLLMEELIYVPQDSDFNDDGYLNSDLSDDNWTCKEVLDDDDASLGWSCTLTSPRPPFTKFFADTQTVTDDVGGDYDAPDCEYVSLRTWDREELTFSAPDQPGDTKPPVVSPSLPGANPDVGDVPFQLCNEVNVLRFGEEVVFGTPMFTGEDLLNNTLLVEVENEYNAGWGRITMDEDENGDMRLLSEDDSDGALVGLPVTGFAAYEFENGFLEGGSVKANYGGLFKHKGLVQRTSD